jgi:hypothetical protein
MHVIILSMLDCFEFPARNRPRDVIMHYTMTPFPILNMSCCTNLKQVALWQVPGSQCDIYMSFYSRLSWHVGFVINVMQISWIQIMRSYIGKNAKGRWFWMISWIVVLYILHNTTIVYSNSSKPGAQIKLEYFSWVLLCSGGINSF